MCVIRKIKVHDTATGEAELYSLPISSWPKDADQAADLFQSALIKHYSGRYDPDALTFESWGFRPYTVHGNKIIAASCPDSWCGDGHVLTVEIMDVVLTVVK